MLVAIFYPLFDGGIQQIRQVYRGLSGGDTVAEVAGSRTRSHAKASPSSPSIGSTSEGSQGQTLKSEAI